MNNFRNIGLWLVIAVLLITVFQFFQGAGGSQAPSGALKYSDFRVQADQGNVKDVTIKGDQITGHLQNGDKFQTIAPKDSAYVDALIAKNVAVSFADEDANSPTLFNIFVSWFPVLLLIGVWIYLMRQMQGGGGRAMGFGKSRAKLLTERQGRVTFEDVAGIDEAKEELVEIVEFLRDPQKFQKLGGRIPKGALLVGPPGTGKTLLARAIAGEANVPFFSISGSDFVEMFVGVGASRVRDMFEQAKKNAPCIIFIDEIDAVGRHRGAGLGGGNDEREQTLNQLLVEMDGFDANEGIIIVAATNRPDVLDPALLRPGRFDRQITVGNPDIEGRIKILKVHLKKVQLAGDIDPRTIARGTPGFSGADLANLVNEAALLAARRNKRVVTMRELEDAKDRVMMGAERKSMVMTEDEKKLTAYHEAGHALVALHSPASDPIHKATIIPRGRALGLVMRLPERDTYSYARDKMKANLAVSAGGRVAEEVVFGHEKVTSGAISDIDYSTRLARAMVTRWGMSDKLGPMAYAENQEEVFLGHSVGRTQNMSDETARQIDAEIRALIDYGYNTARHIITTYRDQLEAITQALLEHETLTGDEMKGLVEGRPIVRALPSDEQVVVKPAGPSVPVTRPRNGDGEPQPSA